MFNIIKIFYYILNENKTVFKIYKVWFKSRKKKKIVVSDLVFNSSLYYRTIVRQSLFILTIKK